MTLLTMAMTRICLETPASQRPSGGRREAGEAPAGGGEEDGEAGDGGARAEEQGDGQVCQVEGG